MQQSFEPYRQNFKRRILKPNAKIPVTFSLVHGFAFVIVSFIYELLLPFAIF